ncbi:MAG: radical SAM protein [Saprospiraceae bacterium]|nr:radical SAM protein [Candidatus Opimibacter iunctus]
MSSFPEIDLDDRWIRSHRAPKNQVDELLPYAFLVEEECTASGAIESVATLFLTNKECPFRCLMCDLWKNTTDERVQPGSIPAQIAYALARLPPSKHIKLYNSGNFFDTKAIPPEDYQAIASLLDPFETVIVECHPKLINDRSLTFRDMIKGKLEVAIGLETAHPEVLEKLNKSMSLDDFSQSVRYLNDHNIRSRAFILLKPPFLTEQEGVHWAKRTLDFAFDAGVGCCVVIPTRAGNGAMDVLETGGFFSKPSLDSLEEVLDYGIALGRGRVFADVWDLEIFSDCPECLDARKKRLESINLHQELLPQISCDCRSTGDFQRR